MEITRFAPSPTGHLHLGHAWAAWVAWEASGFGKCGQCLVRFEDIDITRARPEYEEAIRTDLQWLGLEWPRPELRQSDHFSTYQAALETLRALDLVYPCFCTRAEIQRELAAMGGAPHGSEGPLYPGLCRSLSPQDRARRIAAGEAYSWRFHTQAALSRVGPLTWTDETFGSFVADPGPSLGDVILARKDIGTSYHLAVVIDDARQGVTLITRGEDLLPSTHLHRVLQELLSLPVPRWRHHAVVADAEGRRLAKRHASLSLQSLREAGHLPQEVLAMAQAALLPSQPA